MFNGCGLLHFNPVGGMQTRVADLGENDLDVAVDMDARHVWATQAFVPEEGHVYLQKIDCRGTGQKMIVKYRIDEAERDRLEVSWSVLEEVEGVLRPGGMAGTMGQCGGRHGSR